MLPVVQHCYSLLRLCETATHEMSRIVPSSISLTKVYRSCFKVYCSCRHSVAWTISKFTSRAERIYSLDKLSQ
jgi:hypothetical protein